MHHAPRIFADEIGREFGHGLRACAGAAFEDGLSQADEALVRVHLQKQPARLDEKGFEFCDFHGSSFDQRYNCPIIWVDEQGGLTLWRERGL